MYDSAKSTLAEDFLVGQRPPGAPKLRRGDVVFFKNHQQQIIHVAVALGEGKLLHILNGCESRIENGYVLLERLGLTPAGVIPPSEIERLSLALADKKIGSGSELILLAISIVLSAASYLLAPKLGQPNRKGKYSFDGLATQGSDGTNHEIKLRQVDMPVTINGVVNCTDYAAIVMMSEPFLKAPPP